MSKLKAWVLLSSLLTVISFPGLAQKPMKSSSPLINSLAPATATAGGAGFVLSVTGQFFRPSSVVQWNGTKLSTTVVSTTLLQATVGSGLIAAAGSAQINVYTSGRMGGLSNNLTFIISAPATTTPPPPVVTSPLSITTTSIPGGTTGVAFSYTLAASGGSPAYTWSTVISGGALPPGLALSASGIISGTPTQGGTYSFAVQVSDTSSQIIQKTLSMTVSGSTTATTSGIPLSPGSDIQAAVTANPTGATFVLAPGVYRMQSVVPKSGNVFVGQLGAILNGAILVSTWQQSSNLWVAQVSGITQAASYRGSCQPDRPACMYPEDLFFDSQSLTRVASLSSVGPDAWYFDYSTNKAYVGSDPSGHVVELSALRSAFSGTASNVTIRNLVIEKYASVAGYGAINAVSDVGGPSSGWIVDGNEIRFNHGMGLRISNAMQVTYNRFHHNGQMGLGGSGNDVRIENNEIFNNNSAGYKYGWEAGGTKFTYTKNLIIRGNYAHDNNGPGLWTDINNDYALYENNRTTGNLVAGIIHEISFHATIRNNQIDRDGFSPSGTSIWYGSGISISNSSDVEVYGNTVTNCMTGIGGIHAERGLGPGGTPYALKNLNVHDNKVTQQTSCAVGIVKGTTFDDSVFTSWGNVFRNNTFTLADPNGKNFCWQGQQWTYTQWQDYWSTH